MNFRYGLAARFFHWATALLVLVMFVFGIWISKFEPKDEAFKLQLYNIHESFGILLFVLVLLRLLVRFGNPPAPLEDQPALIRFGAHANHLLLYVLLLVQPVLGFLDTNAWGFPVKWFGLFAVPSPIGKQEEAVAQQLSNAHYFVAIALVALIAMHLLGAAYHGIIRRDGVVRRMI
jgi:cytochrome b561